MVIGTSNRCIRMHDAAFKFAALEASILQDPGLSYEAESLVELFSMFASGPARSLFHP